MNSIFGIPNKIITFETILNILKDEDLKYYLKYDYFFIKIDNCIGIITFQNEDNQFIINKFEVFPKEKGCGTLIMKKIRNSLNEKLIVISDPTLPASKFWKKMYELEYFDYIKIFELDEIPIKYFKDDLMILEYLENNIKKNIKNGYSNESIYEQNINKEEELKILKELEKLL